MLDLWDEVTQSLNNPSPADSSPAGRMEWPPTNILDYPTKAVVVAAIAGFNKDNVNVTYIDGIMTISGYVGGNPTDSGEKIIREEFIIDRFSRTCKVDPKIYDVGSITAVVQDGILTVTIPRITKPTPQVVNIAVG